MTKRLAPTGVDKSASRVEAHLFKETAMALHRPAARRALTPGWVRTAQRTGRNTYQTVMAHVTNPDHYEASRVAPGSPSLKLAPRYAARSSRR
jgi:hypothetical protein